MTINERFFKLLDEKKVSQKDFCESTGIPKQTVSGWKIENRSASIADSYYRSILWSHI